MVFYALRCPHAFSMKRRVIIIAFVGILVLGAGAYLVFGRRTTTNAQGGLKPTETLYTVTKDTLKETLTLSGETDAEERVTLSFPTAGRLSWVGVKEGDVVEKYQGIASLDQRDVEKRLQSSLNSYMSSRWDFEQTKQDNKDAQYRSGDVGDEMKRLIDKAQFSLNNAVITVELQALAKEYSYLYTPIAGIVTRAGAPYAGVSINTTTSYEVVNPATTFFSASADQTEVPLLTVGDMGIVTLDAFLDEPLKATVSSIAYTPIVGDTGTTYEVKIAFPEGADVMKYRMGMTGDVEFVTKEKRNVITIPFGAVRSEGGKKFVTLITETGDRVKTEVKLGDEGDTKVEVIKGLKVGDTILDTSK